MNVNRCGLSVLDFGLARRLGVDNAVGNRTTVACRGNACKWLTVTGVSQPYGFFVVLRCGGHEGEVVKDLTEFTFHIAGFDDFVLFAWRIVSRSGNDIQSGAFQPGGAIDFDRLTAIGSDLVSQFGGWRQAQISFDSRTA
ncbi:hypothetical protein PS624_04617 [Pseudomonas fluorescens]|uniref:Uncharacterized protein n=1 Tax=Pseudomonas fluorescens TaxID=294 RepID=A0A5E6WCF1_PSEFL|nr:hypothetical protein PS624_04617 [Pseudomonas fluorescens]